MAIQKRILGKTGYEATIMGLGGEGVLRTFGYDRDAYTLINRAIDLGINYFESARAYSGSETYYGASLKERREKVFLTSKSHGRSREEAHAHLAETLSNMRTDYLDLWQVHDVRTQQDIARIFGPGGAIEAFDEAKRKGSVRFVGVTGHHDPSILSQCLELYDFDTVLLPVNPAEPHRQSFIEEVIPQAVAKNMGIIGMKIYFRGFAQKVPGYTSMERYFNFALSQSVTLAVIGCDNLAQLNENVAFAESFQMMPIDEQLEFINEIGPYSNSLMYYKP